MPLTLRATSRSKEVDAEPEEGSSPGARRLKHALLSLNQVEENRILTSGDLSKESDLYEGISYSLDVGSLRQHREANRYGNILSYDHSLLPGPYLNASLINPPEMVPSSLPTMASARRPSPLRSYIASQAPIPSTFATFFAHIYANQISKIINLTPLVEHGVSKADAYWPSAGQRSLFVDDGWTISRSSHDERIGDEVPGEWDVVKRNLLIDVPPSARSLRATRASGSTPTSPESLPLRHELTMLHVCSWADFGSSGKVSFQRILNMIEGLEDKCDDAPLWLHCSAGVGRSGTVIASLMARDLARHGLLRAYASKQGANEGTPIEDMALQVAAGLVDHQRRYRPKMVQTPQQLAMVVDVVDHCLSSAASSSG